MPTTASPERGVVESGRSRRRELDAMRAFVVIGLVFFHSARVFDTGDFYVKNEPTSELVDALIAFAVMWGMPLLFLIAGIGIWHSLQSRSFRTFLAERTKRLLVPLIFGVLVIVPPQVWYQVRAETGEWPGYMGFYRNFLQLDVNVPGFPLAVRASETTGYFEYGQLWFLVLLFTWSVALIPFFAAVRRRRTVERIVDLHGSWPLLGASLGLFALMGAFLPLKPEIALWNQWSYLAFVAFGFVLASDRRLGEGLRRSRRWLLAGAVIGFVVFAIVYGGTESDTARDDLLVGYQGIAVVFRMAFAVGGWCWVMSILSFANTGRRQPRRTHPDSRPGLWRRFTAMANGAVLPVYVLHQTVIVVIAFLVVSWPVAAGLKYLILATSALIITLLLYQLVRLTPLTRFLFGMKPPPNRNLEVATQPPGAAPHD